MCSRDIWHLWKCGIGFPGNLLLIPWALSCASLMFAHPPGFLEGFSSLEMQNTQAGLPCREEERATANVTEDQIPRVAFTFVIIPSPPRLGGTFPSRDSVWQRGVRFALQMDFKMSSHPPGASPGAAVPWEHEQHLQPLLSAQMAPWTSLLCTLNPQEQQGKEPTPHDGREMCQFITQLCSLHPPTGKKIHCGARSWAPTCSNLEQRNQGLCRCA